jgi:pimeloyl-ACP methyl ester carboxylesterase
MGYVSAIDPMTRLSEKWAPVMFVHGSEDNIPGRSLELMQRAVKEMRDAGIELELEVVDGAGHLFDHNSTIGTRDLGPSWQSVVRGLDWIVSRI